MIRWMILGLALAASTQAKAQLCVEAPLSTSPTGPTWSDTWERTGSQAEVTFWRVPCEGTNAHLLMTVDPTSSDFFLCDVSFDVVQDGQQFGNFDVLQDPDFPRDTFCDDLRVKTTFIIAQDTDDLMWDRLEAFTVFYSSDNELDIGPFNLADYETGSGSAISLQGALSGSWYDPSRSGEGFALEFAESSVGSTLTAYWFTHLNGEPYWLIGTERYLPGATSVTIDLIEVSGADFGSDFDPDDVVTDPWGAISFEFDSCTDGYAAWEHNGSQGSGELDLQRITSALADGVVCQE